MTNEEKLEKIRDVITQAFEEDRPQKDNPNPPSKARLFNKFNRIKTILEA